MKTHLLHIYAKLGVNDRAAAVAEAFERGLLTPGTRGRHDVGAPSGRRCAGGHSSKRIAGSG